MMNKRLVLDKSSNIAQHLLDLLFPVHCAGCSRSGYVLCSACIAKIAALPIPFCLHCSSPLSPNGVCPSCKYHPLHLSGLRAFSLYQEPLRSWIHALKYHGNVRLAEPLGHLLALGYTGYGLSADIILPVPLHIERQKQRGYNHAQLLAEVCSKKLGIPLREDILIRHRATLAQVDLNPKDRLQNVAGAFLCSPTIVNRDLKGRRILIIDDVCTTGATLEACAAPLFGAGAKEVWGLVLARPS